jgi:hypothetical protein
LMSRCSCLRSCRYAMPCDNGDGDGGQRPQQQQHTRDEEDNDMRESGSIRGRVQEGRLTACARG